MSWMVGEHMLDPDQRMFLEKLRSQQQARYWVRGPVGSGKSVLLVHGLIHHLREAPRSRVAVVVFTHSLIDMVRNGIPRELLPQVKFMTYHEFLKGYETYDLVVVDEVQDLTSRALAACHERSHRLIVGGDPFQSIYSDTVTADDIIQITGVEAFDLTVLHRLTPKIIEIAQVFSPQGGLLAAKRGKLRNVDVTRSRGARAEIEFAYVWETAADYATKGYSTAILLPKHGHIQDFVNRVCDYQGIVRPPWVRDRRTPDYGLVNGHLEDEEIPLQYVGNGYGSFARAQQANHVILMTYHSSKGMDFETVFLPGLHSSTNVWKKEPEQEDTLFFVALTRSRENLFLSYAIRPHELLTRIPDRLVRDVEATVPDNSNSAEDDDDEFIF